MAITKKSHVVISGAEAAEVRRDRAFKTAINEARNLMTQGFEVRIHQLKTSEFRVFGRKAVTR